MELAAAARAAGTNRTTLNAVAEATNPLAAALRLRSTRADPERREKAMLILGQLLLGRCAEIAFEEIYRSEIGDREFALQDERTAQTDTDYRLLNGNRRPIYRINIKFHGSQFRGAAELIGLEAEDCFALATYKIWSALQKQQSEFLPYLFVIVGVPNLRASDVGRRLPSDVVELCGLFSASPAASRKRAFEDALVEHIVGRREAVYEETLWSISRADWYVLSARRAHELLKDKLFERAYALRIRGFAQQFRSAELDMHFSLSHDLTPLRTFLATLRTDGLQKVTTMMERGEF